MAVGAPTVKILDGTKRLRLGRVTAAIVAGIAHARHTGLKQLRVAGAVRLMAVCAVLHYGRMLPKKGAAPFGMAAQAILIGRALNELLGVRRSVWIVATGAGNFSLAVRHVRRALQLGAAHLVALQAQLWLRFLHAAVLR